MNEQTLHARPPVLPVEVFKAVARNAERHPEAKLIVIFDPEAAATVCGFAISGQVNFWSVRSPTTEDMARELLVGELERSKLTEDEIVFLNMRELQKPKIVDEPEPTIN